MADVPTLISWSVSPWSERVRWALDHHGVAHKRIEHVPMIGELRLRRVVGDRKKRPTVPVLIDGDQVLTESWDIAKYAESKGSGPSLFPADRETEIRAWSDLSQNGMASGRVLVTAATLQSPKALDESLPPPMLDFLRPLLRPISRFGARWFSRKYDLSLEARPQHEAVFSEALSKLRSALSHSPNYLLGTFSYADIVMATMLQAVSPVKNEYIRLGPATREVWTNARLASEYPDLIAWRDQLYDQHRRRALASG